MDDLDAFFDEVEEVEEEAKKQVEDDEKQVTNPLKQQEKQNDNSNDESNQNPPPSKKLKVATGSSSSEVGGRVVISKKAVVASAPPQRTQSKPEPVIHQITVPEPPPVQIQQPIIPIQPPLPPGLPPGPKNTSVKRSAAGKTWTDTTLADFPENDFRLFVGNLPKEINEAKLTEVFSSKYSSFVMARIVYDKTTNASKGYGFVSLLDGRECARAIREMDQSWLGNRPIKVKLSDWKERDFKVVQKEKKRKNKNHMW